MASSTNHGSIRDREFNDLVRAWWDVVYETARRILESSADAEDVAQRVFTRVWMNGKWPGIHHPSAFLRMAARNEARNVLRAKTHQPPILALTPELDALLPDQVLRPDEALLRAEEREEVVRLISMLPPRCRRACLMVFIQGASHRAAADSLQVSIKAIEKQVARGRRLLSPAITQLRAS